MITCGTDGKIAVEANGRTYDLASSEQYADFLLWITNPAATVSIDEGAFVVDVSTPEPNRAKAERYAEFLKEFANRRKSKLDGMDGSQTALEREASINAFIERLKSGNE